MANIYPVIMCGGIGSRLWPLSRQSRPKQFANLLGDESLFMKTVSRVIGVYDFRRLIVVTGYGQVDLVAQQLDQLDIDADILLEPEGRDSAAAVACAACHIAELDPDGIAVIVPSDHHIPDAAHFQSDVATAAKEAGEGRIVTLGIKPAAPSSAYGYIDAEFSDGDVAPISAFVEKPSASQAQAYIDKGFLWNSGNFIAQAGTLIREFDARAPGVINPVREALKEARRTSLGTALGSSFLRADKISMDFAIMEKTERASVLRTSLEWMDLGAWDAVHEISERDDKGNSVVGNGLSIDSSNCSIRVSGRAMAVVSHVNGLNVIVEDDVVLVSRLDKSQAVKQVVDRLKRDGSPQFDLPKDAPTIEEHADFLSSWLKTAALPLWLSMGMDHKKGIWREELDSNGFPTDSPIRGRVQGRQDFVFASSGREGWAGPWENTLQESNRGFTTNFRREDGLTKSLVSAKGETLNAEATLYDQTFRLLSLAVQDGSTDSTVPPLATSVEYVSLEPPHLAGGFAEAPMTFKTAASVLAESLLDEVEKQFRQSNCGEQKTFLERDLDAQQSNPIMHLMEATLFWIDANKRAGADTKRWMDLGRHIVWLAKNKLMKPDEGILFESFDKDWNPIASTGANILVPGHLFEWAWLLTKWAHVEDDDECIEIAKRLFERGTFAISPQTGAVVDEMNDDLERLSGRARLWPQCEWLKAAVVLCESSPERDRLYYEDHIHRAARTLRRYLDTPVRGLWYDKLMPGNVFVDEPSPASSLYHITCAIHELGGFAKRVVQ